MRHPLDRLSAYWRDMSLRRRLAGMAAALAINALLLLMLLTLAPYTPGRKTDDGALVTFTVSPPAPPSSERKAVQQQAVHAEVRSIPPPVPPPVPVTSLSDLGLIHMSHDELAQVDTAMRAPPVARAPSQSASNEEGSHSGDTPTASGQGPHGETLYKAAWFREPTNAELGTYLPAHAPPGYGTIACRTVARYHVEDCVALDESPSGSGLSRAVLNAAWQFLVLPPRVGGRIMVGEWVSIRITYRTERAPRGVTPSGSDPDGGR